MAGHASKQIDSKTLWGGKISPFSASYGKLMMWFFLVSDALTFSGLLVAYGFVRHDVQEAWPIGEETFHSLPFLEGNYPLIYVALMTFILIVSSVTMVLAVEAGHRMDKRGVIKWMLATIVGGFFFLGSQAWEWSHFIHGSHFGKVELADGSQAIVKGEFGHLEKFTIIEAGDHHQKGDVITNEDEDLFHMWQHAIVEGHMHDNKLTLHDGSVAKVEKTPYEDVSLHVKRSGSDYAIGDAITGEEAEKMYVAVLNSGEKNMVTYGANLEGNEYGPQQYGQFFFFITGFHGFHVFSGGINQHHCIDLRSSRKNAQKRTLRNGREVWIILALCRSSLGIRIYILLPSLIE